MSERDDKLHKAETREGMKVTTVALPASLHRQLVMARVEENLPLTECVRQAVTLWLRERKASRRKAQP